LGKYIHFVAELVYVEGYRTAFSHVYTANCAFVVAGANSIHFEHWFLLGRS